MPETTSPATPAGPSLLIAVIGLPGEGKTRLLAELAAAHLAIGHRVEGFVAEAGSRRVPEEGAVDYGLRWLASGEVLPWAVRDESLSPPYRFDPHTSERLHAWAEALPAETPLVIMDEFSKFEARGEGLMPVWPKIAAARPHIAVLAVRRGLEDQLEARLGRRFDLRIDATAPDALAQLQQASADYGEWTRLGLFGGAAGGVEMSLGALLHASGVPLRGLFMSSLQGVMMTFAGFGLGQPSRVIWVPFVSAGLKALSPAGNRLRPMLAICMQGALFSLSVASLGWNFFGVALGGALIGAWAAMQGFFLQYLMLGGELLKAYDSVVQWLARHWHITAPGLPWLIGGWTLLHALIAGGAAFAAFRLRAPPPALQNLIDRELARQPANRPHLASAPLWRRIMRDVIRWQFWLPALVVGTILLATGRSWESIAWLTFRFVAVGVVILSLVSLLRPARWAEQLRRRGWWGPALAMDRAMTRRTPHA